MWRNPGYSTGKWDQVEQRQGPQTNQLIIPADLSADYSRASDPRWGELSATQLSLAQSAESENCEQTKWLLFYAT